MIDLGPKRYRIVVEGRLGERFADAFDGMTMSSANGRTVLEGDLSDQAQLFGVLERIRDLTLRLVSVEELAR
jgi:hypothetical protein